MEVKLIMILAALFMLPEPVIQLSKNANVTDTKATTGNTNKKFSTGLITNFNQNLSKTVIGEIG